MAVPGFKKHVLLKIKRILIKEKELLQKKDIDSQAARQKFRFIEHNLQALEKELKPEQDSKESIFTDINFINKLKDQLKISYLAAKVYYVLLILDDDVKVSSLKSTTKINRTALYHLINVLQSKGFIIKSSLHPQYVKALPPLEIFERNWQTEFKNRKDKLMELVNQI
jgi:hypothetical protein